MQDVTDWAFWKLMSEYGGPDIYFTEYFRVTPTYRLSGEILKSIRENPTGRPAIAQVIGNDIPALVRTARELRKMDIVGVDLNLGCPAPVVYKKIAGGGLLLYPDKVRDILKALRDAIDIRFSVKTRLGFDSASRYEDFLQIFAEAGIDCLTIHGRTVKEMYRSSVDYDRIRTAVQVMPCPVWANGNIYSAEKADRVYRHTGAAGLMIGRGAIRNPWIFDQIRDFYAGRPLFTPTGADVLNYIHRLCEAVTTPEAQPNRRVHHLKKYMNFIGLGIEPQDQFLHRIRRAENLNEFFAICREFMDHGRPMNLTPFAPESLSDSDVVAGCHL
jgi:tRNA-dihydrouridine synthase